MLHRENEIMAITNKGKMDASALAEELKAAGPKKNFKDGPRLKDLIVRQSNLPQGSIRMRVLPPTDDMRGLPWVRTEEHFFYDKGSKAICSYICPGMGDPGCKLSNRMIDAGRERDGKSWRAKTQLRMNVIFTAWTDGEGLVEVPDEYKGVRIFEFGRGVWRGTHKTETHGFLKLLQEAETNGEAPFYDTENGCEIVLTKSGYELDTNYNVSLAQVDAEAVVGGRKVKTTVPDISPLAETPEEIAAILDQRHDLKIFLRQKTMDEIRAGLEPFERIVLEAEKQANGRSAPPTKGGKAKPAGRTRTLQEELDAGQGDDDLPPSFG